MRSFVQKENRLTPLTVQEIDEMLSNLRNTQSYATKLRTDSIYDKKITVVSREIDEVVDQVKDIFTEVRNSHKIPLYEIKRDIIPTIQQAAEIPNLFYLFNELHKKDDYTYRHNIGVGVIATLIGKWLNINEQELHRLTLAATLHDIGKTKVPLDILQKPNKLTEDEYEEIKNHCIYGYDMLNNTKGIDEQISLVALQHHERENGEGYPYGITGNKIDYFSKIVAVADVFHAMSSNRIYRVASPFYKVIKEMNDHIFGKFDPNILFVFLFHMMDTTVGQGCYLTDGRQAKIIMINRFDPVNPLVQVQNEMIDLSKEKDLFVKTIIT
ncbi:HD-GYP domain-containing protein [Cytobacillus sp. Hm23]